MRKFIGSREAILRLAERRGLWPFTETGGEVPRDVRKGSDYFCREGYFHGA